MADGESTWLADGRSGHDRCRISPVHRVRRQPRRRIRVFGTIPSQESAMNQPQQQQHSPGIERELTPAADHGEQSYRGSGKLDGKASVITGGDSGIGRAVALAFAREGADVLIAYLNEHDGRRAVLVPGDISEAAHCRDIVQRAIDAFGRIDVLVNNAAFQMSHDNIEDIPDEEWEYTFKVNITAMFHICKAAVKHMPPGSSIINTTSVNSDNPKPTLLAYAATKGAIANFSAGLAQLLAEKGIRVNSVAPGPIWTPLIPSTMPPDQVQSFGQQVPMKRPGQPAEVAPVYVLLASDQASYISGARIAVTGGTPIL
jgi:NAD(P)-dependent dehydrogenase (short-subunit alcohol dehydrogenase family)